ncbi:MAG: putative sensor protein [Pedosphaera sp.]|nr:putative sensor protein [Pedosphaera sp.]
MWGQTRLSTILMKEPLRVLVVEDSEDDALFLIRELRRADFDPTYAQVHSMEALEKALRQRTWDLVISDHKLPGFGSLEALQLVKATQPEIPFIVVSGAIGEEMAVSVVKAGANDYVMKSNLTRLVPSIERELREAEGRRARQKAEDALARSRRELEDFFEHATIGLRWEGPDGTITRVNEAELELLGYQRDEYLGHNIAEFHADEGAAGEVLRKLQAGESLNNYEIRLRCKNGSIKHALLNANVLWENGKFVHSRCFSRDITDRRAAEAVRGYLAAIVESSEDAIIGNTMDGIVLTWNAGAEAMYGYTAEEVKGRSISILIPAYRPEELQGIYEKIRQGEHIERYETVRVRKDGKVLDISLSLSPIKDEGGKVIGVSAIERDITARKREEEVRLKLIQELTDALGNIKTLTGLLPICASCKKIRDDGGYWQKVESYISAHTGAEFTHGICPDCLRQLYPEYTVKN